MQQANICGSKISILTFLDRYFLLGFSMFKALLFSLFLAATSVQAKSVFTIPPYITVEDQGKLTLNFQPVEDIELDIKISSNNNAIKTNKVSQTWSSLKLNKIDLGALKCGEGLHYVITSKLQTEVDNGLYSIPCEVEKPLYFGFMSDTQIKNDDGQKRAITLSAEIADLKKIYPLSLIVNAGDIVQHGGLETEWQNYFSTANVYLSGSYLMAAVGNHEYYDAPTQEKAPPLFLKYMRNNQSSELGYMQLDLGKINLLMLNSNFDFMSESKIKEQWDWLEDKLTTAEKTHKPSIVVMHHAPFSSSLEYVREIPTRLRNELVPMLEKHKDVKMMISGHLHMYEKSVKDGLTYLIAGPSGGINNVVTYKNPYSLFVKSFVTTFSVFKITSDKIEVMTYTGTNDIIDQFSVPLK